MSKEKEDRSVASCLDVEEKEGVCSITLKGLPQQILGMEMGSLSNLWQRLARYDKHPPDVLLLQLKNGLLSPDDFYRMMADFGICSADGLEWNAKKIEEYRYFFLREVHSIQRAVRRFVNIESFTVFSLSGEMMLSLFGGALACDYRIVSDDFVLVNHINNSVFSPLGGLPLFLTWILGRSRAWRLLLETKEIRAEDALAMGLVDRVVPRDRLEQESRRFAEDVASWPWGVRMGLKRTMAACGGALDSYLEVEENVFDKALRRTETAR